MGRLIAIFSILFLCSVGFVLTQLWLRKRNQPATPRAASLLTLQEDGSLYSVDLRLNQLAERMEKAERRSTSLQNELVTVKQDLVRRTDQVTTLEGEVRRLNQELVELVRAQAPPPTQLNPTPPATNAPVPAPGTTSPEAPPVPPTGQ